MSDPIVVAVTLALILLSAFCVVIEFALLGARRARLEADAVHSRSARAALRGMNELTIMLAGAQLGITACTFALGAVTKPALDRWLGPGLESVGTPTWLAESSAFLLSLLFVTFLHLVVGEMAPKSWAIAHPETAAKMIALPARGMTWMVRPLLVWVNSVANRLVAASGIKPVDRAAVGGQDVPTIRHLVELSAAQGALGASHTAQLTQVLELVDLTLGDLLAADHHLVSVPATATVGDVQDVVARTGHMRILLIHEDRDPDVVHVRATEHVDRPARDLARTPLVLQPGTPVYEALGRMRETGEQLAVLAPEGEHTQVDVVTVADILRRVLPEQPAW